MMMKKTIETTAGVRRVRPVALRVGATGQVANAVAGMPGARGVPAPRTCRSLS